MDAELMYECLIYLNVYYYAVFATCEIIMTAAKYRSLGLPTHDIGQDASVVFSVLTAELIKILLFKKFKETRRDLITFICLVLTLVTAAGIAYTFFLQCPALKLEYILCILMALLIFTQFLFGILQLLPCCKKTQYY